jgi:predicted kinase
MTAKKRFKRLVRDRARKTGESYTAALAHVRHRPEEERSMSDRVSESGNGTANGTTSGPLIVVSGAPGVGKSAVSRLIAAAFDRSVHLKTDDFMATVVSGWVDPNLPEAEPQHEAVGGALAVSAMAFAADGYATVVDGHLFPENVAGLAAACAERGLACHYVVLRADLDTCWARASSRGEGRWPLEFEPFAALHARFAALDLPERQVVDATGSPEAACDAVLSAFRAGRLVATEP